MKRNFKYGLSFAAVLLGCSSLVGTQVSAFDITLNGRVDFLTTVGKSITEQRNQAYTGPAHGNAGVGGTVSLATVTAVAANNTATNTGQGDETFIAYLDDFDGGDDVQFATTGRIDVMAIDETAFYDYGAFVRLDVDADAKSVSDTDAHVFIKGNFGKLQFGTDIDADLDAYDMDLMSAGPMSAGNSITLPTTDHEFTMAPHKESSIVYTTPSFNGLNLAGEIDDDGEWMVGASYASIINGYNVAAQGATDSESFALRGKVTAGDLSFGALAGFDDDNESYWGGGIGYNLGPISLSFEGTMAKAEMIDAANDMSFVNADELDLVGGISFKAASGLTLAGSVGYFERQVEGNANGSAAVSWGGSGHQLDGINAQGRIRLAF